VARGKGSDAIALCVHGLELGREPDGLVAGALALVQGGDAHRVPGHQVLVGAAVVQGKGEDAIEQGQELGPHLLPLSGCGALQWGGGIGMRG
jgi:hypothetical protein